MFETVWDIKVREACVKIERYFGEELDHSKLFNIASGCPTSEEIEKCLLGIDEQGKKLHVEFDTRRAKEMMHW